MREPLMDVCGSLSGTGVCCISVLDDGPGMLVAKPKRT